MKRCLTVIAALLLVVGCSAKNTSPQPVLDARPEELASQMWTSLSDSSRPELLSAAELEMLLGLSEKDYAEAVGLFVAEEPLEAQLFLLKAEGEGDALYHLLQQRLELVRQTASAWLGEEISAEQYGRVISRGEWCCLAVPAAHKDQQTEKACEIFLSSFS